jgi:hypothetical protein
MGIIEGGVVMPDAFPRHVNPFGNIRRVVSAGTIQSVVDAALAGDVLYIEAGTYVENVIINKPGLTLVGLGARGQPWINPASGGGLQIGDLGDDTVIVNLGIGGAGAAAWALNIKAAAEVRLYGSKFEGPTGTVVLLDGTDDDQCSNILFDDCEWAWGGSGLMFDNSLYGYPTQIRVKNGLFHNMTAVCIGAEAAGGVVDLWATDNIFARQEDATEPTDYINLDRVGDTGFFGGNFFAAATNSNTLMRIAAGIIWGPNGTEAGWSTARPS